MSLMFFVSGLFVQASLARKGSLRFLAERIVRLGIPFIVAAGLLAPLAYYPAYLQRRRGAEFRGVLARLDFSSLLAERAGLVPVGAARVRMVAALFNLLLPGWSEFSQRLASGAERHPWRFFLGLFVLSALAYVGLSILYDPIAG